MNAFTKTEKLGNGSITLPLGWRGGFKSITIHGGPYNDFPGKDKAFGVCVRAEQTKGREIDLHVPIHDFNVPQMPDSQVSAYLLKIIEAAMSGKTVYVGCMGGWGRTGLFLALIAKAAGVTDPVTFVREYYTSHAVETEGQQKYVDRFDVSFVQQSLPWVAAKTFWSNPMAWWLA